jgi:L,D-transpeptidase ErfK/SrfK
MFEKVSGSASVVRRAGARARTASRTPSLRRAYCRPMRIAARLAALSIAFASLATSACAPAQWVGAGPGESKTYRVRGKSTLLDVARHYDLGYVEVVAANPGVDPWLPGAGTHVVLPALHLPPTGERDGIIINLADMRLYSFAKDEAMRSYPIGIGREGLSTPLGRTTIVRKVRNPTWRPTARMRRDDPMLPAEVPAGPDNPMGTRALYLGFAPYAIHGTNRPFAVGRHVSSGCLRLYTRDIEDLYDRVGVGTKVAIVDEPVKLAWIEGELFMEVHPTQQQALALEAGKPIASQMTPAIVTKVKEATGDQVSRLDWGRVKKIAAERRGYAVRITTPR